MPYHIAGIDVHKKMLAVVVADVAVDGTITSTICRSGPVPRSCAPWRRGSPRATSLRS